MVTFEQAVTLGNSRWWESVPLEEAALFQLGEDKLCMDFALFHKGVEKLLGRPVFTHEFAGIDALREELRGDRVAPTEEEVLAMIPEEKRIVVGLEATNDSA